MACYAGKDGALSIGGTNVAMLTSWNVTQSAETLECAYMGVDMERLSKLDCKIMGRFSRR